ncbi:hypothetical protein [Paenibacillus sp. 2003]|uniref:hypothetical protein n=1 Tax=Paenibacillus TaxID=44249 RepID=UPI00285CE152|nr:hypothetical protein [Paenibacillus sp. 2003]MDR6720874.1 hypothetical protein [Paenibacillus sp. 2003]
MQQDNNQEILEQRDVDNLLIFIIYFLVVILGNVRFPGFYMAILLYISTLWYFNRVGLFRKVSKLRLVILALYVQIILPLLTTLTSVTKLIEVIPNSVSGNVRMYIVLGFYIFAPIILNLISFAVFKKHEHFRLNQKPALEIGRMLIWGTTLTLSILVITDEVNDAFLKVSLLIVMAPLLMFNYAVKIVYESDSALDEYKYPKNN